jgi:type IV pilus assembly protein PilA
MKKNSGFSLIELMVVVAIMGILAGMGALEFNEYLKRSNDKVAQSDARNLLLAISASRH